MELGLETPPAGAVSFRSRCVLVSVFTILCKLCSEPAAGSMSLIFQVPCGDLPFCWPVAAARAAEVHFVYYFGAEKFCGSLRRVLLLY